MKNTFYLDHFDRKWFALELTDSDDLEFVMKNRPWYVCGQIFHLERLTTQFSDMIANNKMVVWARLPCVLVQYKEVQPLCDIIRVDEVTLGLSGLFVKVFVEVDLRFPLKRVLIVSKDDDKLILISYEKLFEVCFYYGRRMIEADSCP